jgi:maltooligosyltrehalose trehalohydrolase
LSGNHAVLLRFYKKLIHMRKSIPALAVPEKDDFQVSAGEEEKLVLVERREGDSRVVCLFNFNEREVKARFPCTGEMWGKLLDSSDFAWSGPGAVLTEKIRGGADAVMRGRSCAVYLAETG